MNPEETECLEQWKSRTLSRITEHLAGKIEILRIQPVEVFKAVVSLYGRKATAGFMAAFGFTDTTELDTMSGELKDAYCLFIVSALNSALPLDFPYLVVLAFSDRTKERRMCVVDRKEIPGMHERVSPNIVPIIRFQHTAFDGKSELRLMVEDAKYLATNDNLEDLYKL